MFLKNILCLIVLSFLSVNSFSQISVSDSVLKEEILNDKDFLKQNEQQYDFANGKSFIYYKPKPFSFIFNIPKDAAGIAKEPFKKKSINPLLIIASSTIILWLADEKINLGVYRFSKNINWNPDENYKDVLNLKIGKTNISLFKAPLNINTGLYQLGQGFPSLLIAAGLFTHGKIHKNYRSLSTANQLAESFVLMGIGTQLLKRIAGRQTPGESTSKRGEWNVLPSFKNYQQRTPFYDAFPSGHLATLMSTLTVLTENYPEIKWIKPIGYSVTALVAFTMINNEVHWASDYPLALGLGYLCAKQVIKHHRKQVSKIKNSNVENRMSYSIGFSKGIIMPKFVYKL